MSCYEDASFGLTSFVSTLFYWPYPHESSSDFFGGRTIEFMRRADSGRRVRDRIEYRYEVEGFIGYESFALVSVDLDAGNLAYPVYAQDRYRRCSAGQGDHPRRGLWV